MSQEAKKKISKQTLLRYRALNQEMHQVETDRKVLLSPEERMLVIEDFRRVEFLNKQPGDGQ
ncbi:hypothetical protein [Neptuniibacter sp. QD37_11]|uniref:hypothetical protein n=1 Tax=Neptuniibacter sp. QD37_11 TaxID=3398209 RepID=UPI0039F5F234